MYCHALLYGAVYRVQEYMWLSYSILIGEYMLIHACAVLPSPKVPIAQEYTWLSYSIPIGEYMHMHTCAVLPSPKVPIVQEYTWLSYSIPIGEYMCTCTYIQSVLPCLKIPISLEPGTPPPRAIIMLCKGRRGRAWYILIT